MLPEVARAASFRIDSSHCLNQRSKLPVMIGLLPGQEAAASQMRA
jgi:hypothetical protein